jgi:hypothetical protein
VEREAEAMKPLSKLDRIRRDLEETERKLASYGDDIEQEYDPIVEMELEERIEGLRDELKAAEAAALERWQGEGA